MAIVTDIPVHLPPALDNGGAGCNLRHRRFGGNTLAIDGSDDWSAVLEAASAEVASEGGNLIVGPGIYGTDDDADASAAPIKMEPGAVFRPASTKTLTLPANFQGSPGCLDGSLGGSFVFDGAPPYFDGDWFGVVRDGSTPALAALQAALDAAPDTGAVIRLGPGEHRLDGRWNIQSRSKILIEGAGSDRTKLLVEAGSSSQPTILIQGGNSIKLKGFRVEQTGIGLETGAGGNGLTVDGPNARIVVEDVFVLGFGGGMRFTGSSGSPIKHLFLDRCGAERSNGYGMLFEHCERVVNWMPWSCHHRMDGVKLADHVTDYESWGGVHKSNGWIYDSEGAATPYSENGNGIDCFAGGDTVTFWGGEFDHNNGGGIYAKTGGQNDPDTGELGLTRNIRAHGVKCRWNETSGFDINRVGGNTEGHDLLDEVSVVGGEYIGNKVNGMALRARNISICGGPLIADNYQMGIEIITAESVIIAPGFRILGNGHGGNKSANGSTYYGIGIGHADSVTDYPTRNVQIGAGIIDGAPYPMQAEKDYTPTYTFHRFPIYVKAGVRNVDIKVGIYKNWTTGVEPVVIDTATISAGESVRIDYGHTTRSPVSGLPGGIGSTCVYDNGSGTLRPYTKLTGPDSKTGWVLVRAKGGNRQTLSGSKTLATADPQFQSLDGGASDRNVTLPAASSEVEYTIGNRGTTNNLVVRDNTPTNLLTLAPGEVGTFVSDGTGWMAFKVAGAIT